MIRVILIILIVVLLIILGLSIPYWRESEGDIGNYLSVYCIYIASAFLQKRDFKFTYIDKPFLKHLPLYIKFNQDIYDKLKEDDFTYIKFDLFLKEGYWQVINNRREKFWLIMKPLMNQIIDDTLKKSGLYKKVQYPVIHFRCSDIPFIRNKQYKLQKYTFYKDSLDKIKSQSGVNYDTIILLTSTVHRSNSKNKEACEIYLNGIKNYIESIGYKVIIQSKSKEEDFATLFYAPAVISPGSSFSFMGGFFNDGLFISEGHQSLCNNCGKWLVRGYGIDHNKVDNYYDTSNVITLLKEPFISNKY